MYSVYSMLMAYTIRITDAAAKMIKKLDRQFQSRISRKIDELAYEPRPTGAAKLEGAELYRVRVGDFRIVYEIHDAMLIVIIVRVGNRKEVYR